MSADYEQLTTRLEAQRASRKLSPEITAELRDHPMFPEPEWRRHVLEVFRQWTPEERTLGLTMLREWRERASRDAELWTLDEAIEWLLSEEVGRWMAQVLRDRGDSVAAIAEQFTAYYEQPVSPEMVTALLEAST